MSTSIVVHHDLNCTPEELVEKIHWNEAYHQAVFAKLDYRYELVESNRETGVRKVRIWPSDIPGVVRKALGDDFHFFEEGVMDPATGRYEFKATPSAMSDKIGTTGYQFATPLDGGGCRREVCFDITANIKFLPGVGKIIEKFVVSTTRKSYDDSAGYINDFLAGRAL